MSVFDIPVKQTGDQVSAQEINDIVAAAGSYKCYVAAISQTGTDAPVPIIYKNTLGIVPVWYRNFAGYYSINDDDAIGNEGVFTEGKTVVFLTSGDSNIILAYSHASIIGIDIFTAFAATGIREDESMGTGSSIEIRVYQ